MFESASAAIHGGRELGPATVSRQLFDWLLRNVAQIIGTLVERSSADLGHVAEIHARVTLVVLATSHRAAHLAEGRGVKSRVLQLVWMRRRTLTLTQLVEAQLRVHVHQLIKVGLREHIRQLRLTGEHVCT